MPKFLSDGFFDGSSTDLTVDGKINISDYIVHTGDTNSYFGFGLNDYIKFVTSGSEKFYISSSNVTSITTHDFLSNLYTSNVTGRTDTDTKIEFPGSDVMTFKTGNSERIKINASGYVGINETNPEQMLHVAGNFRLENQLYDSTNSQGSVGQILSKVSAGTQWIDQGDVIAGEADKAKSVILRVKNSTASAMSKGQVVCEAVSATPPNGSLIEVALADNNGTNTMPALGILNDDLDAAGGNNDEGDAIMFGKVSGIDTSAFSVGDEVFVDDTPGGLTTTKPTGVKYIQKVGVVIRDDDTNGTIEVFGAGRTNDVPTPLYIDHTNQRLGIGETDPSEKLHVDGRAYIESQGVDWNETTPGTGRGSLHFDPVGDGADNTGNAITFGASDTSNGSNAQAGIYTRSDGTYGTKMYFATTNLYTAGSKTRMTIDYDGNVGIGTTDPGEKLAVSGGNIEIADNAGGRKIGFNVSDSLSFNSTTIAQYGMSNAGNSEAGGITYSGFFGQKFFTNGAQRMVIERSGDVGIGVTDPGAKLDVNGNIKMTETPAGTGIDKFAVLDSGVIKYRTGSQLLSDIGGTDGSDSLQLIDVSEPGNTTAEWSLIKTLPATTGSTRDTLFIKVVGGAWNDHGRYEAEITLSNRDSFNYFWEVKGGDEYNGGVNGSNRLRVIAYSQTDGTVDVYLYKTGYMTGYIYATFQNTGGPEIITSLGSPTTTQPSGTVAFSTHGETYPANISSVNGKVGINAAYPGKMLELRGGANEAAIRLRDTGSNVWDIQNSTFGKLDFIRGGSSTYMRIDQLGNVGIGTTDPASQLHVRNDDAETATAAGITVEQDGTGDAIVQYLLTGVKRWTTGIDNSDGDKFKISQNADLGSDNVMTFDTAGKVGIGTAQPNAKLEVDSDDAFKTVQLTGTSPAIYFNEDDSASTDNWHLGVNGGALYFLRDTDKNGAYNNIAAYFSGNNLISEGNFYAKGNTFSFGASTSEGEYITRSGNDIRFIAGGDTRMTVDGDGGYIGIKTTNPQYSLDVNDDKQRFGENSKLFLAKASNAFPSYSDINTESAFISHNSGTSRAVTMGVSDDSNIAAYVHINELNNPGTSFVSIGTNTQERLRVKADGKVGIGTAQPNRLLTVQTTGTGCYLALNSSSNNTTIGSDVNGGFIIYDDSSSAYRMVIDAATGDVGIGTTDPGAKLHISSGAANEDCVVIIESDTDNNDETSNPRLELRQDGGAVIGRLGYRDNTNSLELINQYAEALYLGTSNSTDLTILSNGDVGIGVTSPAQKLDVNGAIKSNTRIFVGYDSGVTNSISCSNWFRTSGNTGIFFASHGGGVYQTDSTYVRLYNSKALQVDNTGTSSIRAAGDIVAYYSDERLKTNLGNITNAVDKVKKLNGFYYKNNELANSFGYTEDHLQVGVSAQEVEAIMPEVVKPAPFDFKTKENGEGYSASGENYKTVKYEKLVPLLIEAIKEQQKQIDELKKQLDAHTK